VAEKPAPAPAQKSAPPRLSIVVLPFKNLSSDPDQDYFADGVTENLTTDLSRIRNSFVIARNTAFTFKGKAVDAKQIGKELGVRYVLEGSVQRDQNRVRVNAQLIDSETGAHLWADRFQEDVADLFKLQDDVVARLANALSYELVRAEAETAARSRNPDSIDLDMRGRAAVLQWAQQPPTNDDLVAVRANSNWRSRSTRRMPMHWPARRPPICTNTCLDGSTPKPTTRQRYSVRPTDPSRSHVTTLGHLV
jgi:TolB-like protein